MSEATGAPARANARQLEASDPTVSAFVAASAGSGKTKLLIDRLLRLMLGGADPAAILCLTFTKAAAAEMALRLQARLGEWVTLPGPALAEALKTLHVTPDEAALRRARALFAIVLDLPGGMRIDTIHAFCQSLLRRFPLEAAIPPHFRLLEEADGRAELATAREAALAEADPAALEAIAGLLSAGGFADLVVALQGHSGRLAAILAAPDRLARLQRAVGVSGTEEALLEAGAAHAHEGLDEAIAKLRKDGTPGEKVRAERVRGWLNLPLELRTEHWDEWIDILLKKDGEPRAPGAFAAGKYAKSDPSIAAAYMAAAEHAAQVEDDRRALRVAAATDALLRLADPVLDRFAHRKRRAGLLDYDDMIRRTRALLFDPGAAWVLFKLDSGLDHLLLDEVQDTAPEQWKIAGALTAEFFAGEGANRAARTVFAVGDRKQSIYSFQGAEPAEFDRWRGIMRERVTAADGVFRDTALDVSFRSTDAVLALVDQVFAAEAEGVVLPGETLRHEAARAGHAGCVELWPLVPPPPKPAPAPWAVARENTGLQTALQRLADGLAQWIRAQIGRTELPARGRTVQPGDILILVRRRNEFATALVRRLKALGVPVAGLDRLYLTQQPAVQDLLALCDALLLPADDLQLACVLTSPLGGLDDDDLMALAIGRESSLWSALRARRGERPHWERIAAFLEALFARVDYVSPHALLVEALGPLGARARLLARLGPEAAEPIDELLGAALLHGAAHPPSLQGFVHWLRQSGAEVKREAEGGGGTVRIMTVHGAKGLQAPLVILPDTVGVPRTDTIELVWDGDTPLWSPRRELRCAAVTQLREAEMARQLEEYRRLLYVALTRAEDRLLVCGWDSGKGAAEASWYEAVKRGMAALGAVPGPLEGVGDAWDGAVLSYATTQRAASAAGRAQAESPRAALPDWTGRAPDWRPHPAPAEPARPEPLAPSRPDDVALGPVPFAASPLMSRAGALERGSLVHRLLQHAPALPPGERHAAMLRAGATPTLAAEVAAILDHPALAPLFGPGSRAEQPITGLVGDAVISAVVDRMVVLEDAVLVADYKTNRDAPASEAEVPVLYLRQMAAYRAVLRAAFPGRSVRTALVWTREVHVMPLSDAVLDTASCAPQLVADTSGELA